MTKIIQANCETGEVLERDMAPEEQALHDSMVADGIEFNALAANAEALKQSAKSKLSALGLTEEEVQALLG